MWICLGLTLIFLTYIIPRLSELTKRIYVTKAKESIDKSQAFTVIGAPVIDFSNSMGRNGMYILSLLTYQGIKEFAMHLQIINAQQQLLRFDYNHFFYVMK